MHGIPLHSVAQTADCSLIHFIADSDNNVVRIIYPSGIIDTYAGTGTAGSAGDGLTRRQASFYQVWKTAVHPLTGDVYVTEGSAQRVRRIDAVSDIVTTLLGAASATTTITASLTSPRDLMPYSTSSDTFLLTDNGGARIYMLNSTARTATAVVGSGTAGYLDGPALSGQLSLPARVIQHTASGLFLVAEYGVHRVRTFSIGGNVSTLAGSGVTTGPIGDGGASPLQAVMNCPIDLAWQPGTGHLAVSSPASHASSSDTVGPRSTPHSGACPAATTAMYWPLQRPLSFLCDSLLFGAAGGRILRPASAAHQLWLLSLCHAG